MVVVRLAAETNPEEALVMRRQVQTVASAYDVSASEGQEKTMTYSSTSCYRFTEL